MKGSVNVEITFEPRHRGNVWYPIPQMDTGDGFGQRGEPSGPSFPGSRRRTSGVCGKGEQCEWFRDRGSVCRPAPRCPRDKSELQVLFSNVVWWHGDGHPQGARCLLLLISNNLHLCAICTAFAWLQKATLVSCLCFRLICGRFFYGSVRILMFGGNVTTADHNFLRGLHSK